jgi:hypothetical protein
MTIVLLVAVLWLVGCALCVAFVMGATRLNAAADVVAEAERIINEAS